MLWNVLSVGAGALAEEAGSRAWTTPSPDGASRRILCQESMAPGPTSPLCREQRAVTDHPCTSENK